MDVDEPSAQDLTKSEIYYFLRSRFPRDQEEILSRIDALRDGAGLDRIRAAAIISISSYCVRDCIYCGMRAEGEYPGRFRLSRGEIVDAAEGAYQAGIRWLILKSGDDLRFDVEATAELTRDLITRYGFAVTLAMGEQPPAALARWREAGALSYWLRMETCDPYLYKRIRPSMYWVDRVRTMKDLEEKGLAAGSGILVGIPNQGFESLVDDLFRFQDPAVFAAAIEPCLPPSDSPAFELSQRPENMIITPDQAAIIKVMAVARILRPDLVIPLTGAHVAAFDALRKNDFFRAGANAVLLDFTPRESLLEAHVPFTGWPAGPRAVDELRGRLDDLMLSLELEPPLALLSPR